MQAAMPYIWITIMLVSVVAEVSSYALVSVCFLPAAAAAFVMGLTGAAIWLQALIFLAVAAALILLSKTALRRLLKSGAARAGVLVGQSAIVTGRFAPESGQVRLNGTLWKARYINENKIEYPEPGEIVEVTGVDGAGLVVARKEE